LIFNFFKNRVFNVAEQELHHFDVVGATALTGCCSGSNSSSIDLDGQLELDIFQIRPSIYLEKLTI
jgi:hypothetical protein